MDFYGIIGIAFFAALGTLLLAIEIGLFREHPKKVIGGVSSLFGCFLAIFIYTYQDYEWTPSYVPTNKEGGAGGAGTGGGGGGGGGDSGGQKGAADGGGGGGGGGAAGDGGGGSGGKVKPGRKGDGDVKPDGLGVGESADANPDSGKLVKDCDVCPELVVIPAGRYVIGSEPKEPGHQPHEAPQQLIKIFKPIAVGRFELKRDEFAAFLEDSGYEPKGACASGDPLIKAEHLNATGFVQSPDHPVVCVSRLDAKMYLAWLYEKTGKLYRLLSAAEWEYAARAGSTGRFHGSSDIGRWRANYGSGPTRGREAQVSAGVASATASASLSDADQELKLLGGTMPVGSFSSNAFGLYDMHGNVAEWVEDCWQETLEFVPDNGRAISVGYTCRNRTAKGGAWYDPVEDIRLAARRNVGEKTRDNGLGFRVARTFLDEAPKEEKPADDK